MTDETDENRRSDEAGEPREYEETVTEQLGVSDAVVPSTIDKDVLAWYMAKEGDFTPVQKQWIKRQANKLRHADAGPSSGGTNVSVTAGDLKIGSTFPAAKPVVTETAEAQAAINLSGEEFRRTVFEPQTDAGLLFMVANPRGEFSEPVRIAASAEMGLRQTEAMISSANKAHWAAFMVFSLAVVQVVFLFERLYNG
ncbi:MAG: hypothetical protein M5U23_02585 [Acidimicrobiia bacterium]|nr:hypothetical protein [Acidimicrobiia bacterium]